LIDTGSIPELSKGIASFEAVAWKMANPYYFWLSILFVAFLMIHVLNGIRMIILDVATGHSFRKFIGIIFFLAGVLVVLYIITFNSLVVMLG
ncbi:MAG: hypothetical protein KAT16_06010, partial [Candidatus Heimdallarchaeota archaeon]|nr:hypothetical protein [Candidatus Heimdallarchaeota archaeon]